MTRHNLQIAALTLCAVMHAARSIRADEAVDPIKLEVAALGDETEGLARRLLPPVLLDRAGVEAVFGTDSVEVRSGRFGTATEHKYPLTAAASLWVGYVDGYAAVVYLRGNGEVWGAPVSPPPEKILARVRGRRDWHREALEAFAHKLPPDGIKLPADMGRKLVVYLAEHPSSRLGRAIIEHLPAEHDADLLTVLVRLPAGTAELLVPRRLRAVTARRPELSGQLIEALADAAVDAERKEVILEALTRVAGYGGHRPWVGSARRGNATASAEEVQAECVTWWRAWWERHQEHPAFDRLMEPLAITPYRASACAALAIVDDARTLPLLARLLEDDEQSVRVAAALGLLRRKLLGDSVRRLVLNALREDEAALLTQARDWARAQGLLGD